MENEMARPKGSKNKDAEKKLEDALELVAEAHAIAPEEMKGDIAEAVEELVEALVTDVPHTLKCVGHHPITKEPVYA
jgi:hypothetical protein